MRTRYQFLITFLLFAISSTLFSHDLPGEGFAGVWAHVGNMRKLNTDPVLTDEAQAWIKKLEEYREQGDYTGDNSALCIPPALPTMITIGAQEILVDEKKLTWIMESISGIRWIWLDGRSLPNPEEERPTAFGYSVGHWEGNTLVVETIGFMDSAMIYVNRPNNESVYPGPEMHVVERMHLEEDGNVIISERTVTDPKNFKEPWVTTVRYERRPDWELAESICAENNQTDEYE